MHPGGRLLLVSNRGYDSIAVFAVDLESGQLQRLGIHPTRGTTPRAFGIDPRGTFVYVANQNADSTDCDRIDPEGGRSGLHRPDDRGAGSGLRGVQPGRLTLLRRPGDPPLRQLAALDSGHVRELVVQAT